MSDAYSPDQAMARRLYAQLSGDATLNALFGSPRPVEMEFDQAQVFPCLFFRASQPAEWAQGANLSELQFRSVWLVLAVDQQPPGTPDFASVLDPAAKRIHDLFHGVTYTEGGFVSVARCVRQVRRRASLAASEKLIECGWTVEMTGGRTT